MLQDESINNSEYLKNFNCVISFKFYMYTISCRDVGRDCDCVVQGETEEEIIKNAAEHAVKDHGYKEEEIMSPEMKEKIKSYIRKY